MNVYDCFKFSGAAFFFIHCSYYNYTKRHQKPHGSPQQNSMKFYIEYKTGIHLRI
ncbi:hypothetical protein HanIR_Chr01g0026201 [Helianthus annuus]|nr:hypothetical protein HanIR_Chr01g0026201 [Helianthus annuus]